MEEQRSFDLNVDPEGPEVSSTSSDGESASEAMEVDVPGNISEEEIKLLEFETLDKVHSWYMSFGQRMGFSVRVGGDTKDPKTGKLTGKCYYCSCEGFRDKKYLNLENRAREAKAITRTGCMARVRVKFDKVVEKWKISVFVNEHNHEMVCEKQRKMLRSNRKVTDGDYVQAAILKKAGVDTGQIMMFYSEQAGGALNMDFSKRDLQNRIQREKARAIEGGDIQNSLAFFDGKKDKDSGFYYKYTVDEGRLENMLWADSESRLDYQVFGDVLAFDATYKKNSYNLPLLVFVGVNNHHQTIIFALAVLKNEKHESYVWVLNEFIRCMGGKHPISVVTDGDRAMLSAVKEVMPEANHRLCVWHLQRNLFNNISQIEVRKAFKRCLYSKWTEEVFDREWAAMVEKYCLQSISWINEKHKMRRYWAQSLLNGQFFGRMITTSRNEGVNSYLKRYVRKTNCFMEFLNSLEVALSNMRRNEAEADFKSRHTKPVINCDFEALLTDAAKVYTRNSFKRFRKELNRCHALIIKAVVSEINDVGEDTKSYTLSKYSRPEKIVIVVYHRSLNSIRCSCLKFESDGIPCRHSIKVMINEAMKCIPPSCIDKRWTLNAKIELNKLGDSGGFDDESLRLFRQAMTVSIANLLSRKASANQKRFHELRDTLLKLGSKWDEEDKRKSRKNPRKSIIPTVGDPIRRSTWYQPSTSKGEQVKANKRQYRCSHCGKSSHNIKSCPQLNSNPNTAADSDSEYDTSDEEMGENGRCWGDAILEDEDDDEMPPPTQDADLNYEALFGEWL